MSTHTPGPWRAKDEDVLGPKGMAVAWCTTGFSYNPEADGYSIGIDEAYANALLIAAAPEMLQALENLLATVEYYDLHKYYFNPDDVNEALAIITRAKGL